MLITKEQAVARLTSPDNLATQIVNENHHLEIRKIDKGGGRSQGDLNLTNEERALIGTLARVDSAKNVSDTFGISLSHIENLKEGRTDRVGLERKTHDEFREKLNGRLNEVQDKALDKLMSSLGLLTEDKIAKAGAKDISTVAANMSKVVERTLPKEKSQGNQTNIVIYTPAMKEVVDFKMVEI